MVSTDVISTTDGAAPGRIGTRKSGMLTAMSIHILRTHRLTSLLPPKVLGARASRKDKVTPDQEAKIWLSQLEQQKKGRAILAQINEVQMGEVRYVILQFFIYLEIAKMFV